MTHAELTPIARAWSKLAPKLIAFLATGLTASAVIWAVGYVGGLFGYEWHLTPELAMILVGAVSTVAGYIQRDHLLDLPANQIALKVLVFALSGITATGVLALASALGLDVTPYAPLITAAVTVLAGVIGYLKSDGIIPAGIVGTVPIISSTPPQPGV
jgi:hypothetical protein